MFQLILLHFIHFLPKEDIWLKNCFLDSNVTIYLVIVNFFNDIWHLPFSYLQEQHINAISKSQLTNKWVFLSLIFYLRSPSLLPIYSLKISSLVIIED